MHIWVNFLNLWAEETHKILRQNKNKKNKATVKDVSLKRRGNFI